ncbi:MAG: glycosyltransferase family 2 protein [Planctomycetota bacterium]
MKLSVVVPAHNEEGCIEGTVRLLSQTLTREAIEHEIVVVNDCSTDRTAELLDALAAEIPELRVVATLPPNGFGFAVATGIDACTGDAVGVFMADASDDPEDLVRFYRELVRTGADCVFGSRFMRGGRTIDYPLPKLVLNRIANTGIRLLFGLRYNDVTNAFKLYRRETLEGSRPFISRQFNLTVELPLKAIVRGYDHYTVLPNSWTNRAAGESKLRVKEMGSRYAFTIIYCLIEKWLSRGDYHRRLPLPRAGDSGRQARGPR